MPPNRWNGLAQDLTRQPARRIPMTCKKPRLHATPQALARAVVRTRPHLGPEQIKVFEDEAEAGRKARDLARTSHGPTSFFVRSALFAGRMGRRPGAAIR